MKIITALFLSALSISSPLAAQQKQQADLADLTEQILTLREPNAFEKAMLQAKQAGSSAQVLFEARFLFYIDKQDFDKLSSLLPQAEKLSPDFKAKNSEIFASKEDWLAVLHYIKAIDASQRGNDEEFKKFITEAFWLSPSQAPAFAHHIEAFKIEKLKKNLILSKKQNFAIQGEDKQHTFEQLVANKKGILIYAYSPWSREAVNQAPQVVDILKHSKILGLAQLQYNIENPKESEQDNLDYKKAVCTSDQIEWVEISPQDNLIETLRIQSTPTLIVINKEGKVLFHGSAEAFLKFK